MGIPKPNDNRVELIDWMMRRVISYALQTRDGIRPRRYDIQLIRNKLRRHHNELMHDINLSVADANGRIICIVDALLQDSHEDIRYLLVEGGAALARHLKMPQADADVFRLLQDSIYRSTLTLSS